jgi:hypothetical protein
MPIHDFQRSYHEDGERFESIDDLPDFRSDVEKLHTPLAVYNHAKNDLAMAERLAEEAVNVSGAFVTVYVKEPYVDREDIDDVYDEDADPVYRPGLKLKAWFKTDTLNVELTRFGVDSPLQLTVVFARAVLAKSLGLERLITVGDIIEVPYNNPRFRGAPRFRVVNAYDSGNMHYRWLYYTTICELIVGDDSLKVPFNGDSKIR